jgi:FMN-dependent NADH-azoreductase
MSNVLVINSAITGEASVSRALVSKVVAELKAQGEVQVAERDLAADPIPQVDGQGLAGFFGEPSNETQVQARARSEALIAELKAADVVVIGAPMYNFGMSTQLKAWFDHVLRAGVTFRYTEAGPEGLLKGKRAIIVTARGNFYGEGPLKAIDFQEPHVRHLLSFIGVTDVTFVRAEGLALSPEAKVQGIAAAEAQVADAVRPALAEAA